MRHIPHLYLPPPWSGDIIPVGEDQAHHLRRVLRLSSDSPVSYTDGAGTSGTGILAEGGVRRGPESTEPGGGRLLKMAVAPPANRDRVRFVVEKLSEIGVDELIWIETKFTQGKPPPFDRARSWAVAALEQSRGDRLMHITQSRLTDLVPPIWLASVGGGRLVPEAAMTMIIGPEGGLDPAEIPPGSNSVSLGPRILRVETAAIVAAALIRNL